MLSDFIFGMGTGRCGTWTLSNILNEQVSVVCGHEGVPLPWQRDVCQLWYELLQLEKHGDADKIANVSFVWINYVGQIMGNLIDPKCICLKRPKNEVVESFCKHTPFLNHWTDPKSLHFDPNKDESTFQSNRWPKFDLPKKEAIGAYWQQYYEHAEYLQKRYPDNFKIFDMQEALNTESGQRQLLSFAGIDEQKQIIFLNQKLNQAGKPKGRINVPTRQSVYEQAQTP